MWEANNRNKMKLLQQWMVFEQFFKNEIHSMLIFILKLGRFSAQVGGNK